MDRYGSEQLYFPISLLPPTSLQPNTPRLCRDWTKSFPELLSHLHCARRSRSLWNVSLSYSFTCAEWCNSNWTHQIVQPTKHTILSTQLPCLMYMSQWHAVNSWTNCCYFQVQILACPGFLVTQRGWCTNNTIQTLSTLNAPSFRNKSWTRMGYVSDTRIYGYLL